MDENQIIDLYWERSESAIDETSRKYGKYCHCISYNILHNTEDAEECVNDAYMRAWNAIPPSRPNQLSTFLGKITRNLSYDKCKKYTAEKRGFGQTALVLSELEECVPSFENIDHALDEVVLVEAINNFLASLPQINRIMFVRRYWYLCQIREIAEQYGMNENKVKSMLFRARNELKKYLEKEGIVL
jgi:RNA polymerase sigma factor, sigma-70 family